MKIKNIQLKNWNLKNVRGFDPYKEGVEIKWTQDKDDKHNNETYASIIANNKQEINNQLSILSNNIGSERARTLNSIPKWRIIQTTKKRIY